MESIKNRRSIRKFKSEPIDHLTIEQIISAGILAPSAKNRQPWKFIVFTGKSKENLLIAMERGLQRESNGKPVLPESSFGIPDAYNSLRIMREAPVLIIVMNTNGKDPYQPIQTDARISEICDSLAIGAAIENMLLEAETIGLGTLWIANTCFAYPELIEEIKATDQLVCAIALGYPAESPLPRPRKDISEILEYRE